MTKKPRFGSFVTSPGVEEVSDSERESVSSPATNAPVELTGAGPIPQAPMREERRAFSTRVRLSQKAALDGFVMDLKKAGWPVSQEGVLEELLRLLQEDEHTRQVVTSRLTKI